MAWKEISGSQCDDLSDEVVMEGYVFLVALVCLHGQNFTDCTMYARISPPLPLEVCRIAAKERLPALRGKWLGKAHGADMKIKGLLCLHLREPAK